MGFYLSPLVKVREIDLSTTIPAVATSIGAIVLRNTYKGPEMKRVLVTNEVELANMFGEPTDTTNCYIDWLSAAGYLKYGNKLYVTRALATGAKFAQTVVSASIGKVTGTYTIGGVSGTTGIVLTDLEELDPINFGTQAVVPTTTGMFMIANSRGEHGNNIRVAFIDRATQYGIGLYPGAAGYVTGTEGNPWKEFRGIDSKIAFNSTTQSGSYPIGIAPTPTGVPYPTAPSMDFLVMVQVKDQGKNTYTTKETWNVSTDPRTVDDQGLPKYIEKVINEQSQYVKVAVSAAFDSLTVPSAAGMTADTWFTFAGGTGTNDVVTAGTINESYDLYSNPEELDVNLFIDSDKGDTVRSHLIEICESRMDCMSILDCRYQDVYNKKGYETTNLLTWINQTFNQNTSYAAVYANWLEVYDKYNQKYRWVPASGHMAGIYAKTDDVADPWWAPAGLNRAVLTGVRRLAWNPTLGNRDMLYSNKLNPIVSFSGQGKVVWGQKTLLSKSSAFDRVNVRRLFIILEKAISTACKYFIFEPNDPATRNLMVNMIVPFLRDIKSRRGIYDFLVVADETVNTPERIDRNELWVNIFIKPTRTAEFIVLNFIATKTGASFTELASAV